MWRRAVYCLVGVLGGYLIGAVIGMVAFAAVLGNRSIAVYEESNRNRWTFIAAASAAVLGGVLAWWRSYTDIPTRTERGTTPEVTAEGAAAGDGPVEGGDGAAETGAASPTPPDEDGASVDHRTSADGHSRTAVAAGDDGGSAGDDGRSAGEGGGSVGDDEPGAVASALDDRSGS